MSSISQAPPPLVQSLPPQTPAPKLGAAANKPNSKLEAVTGKLPPAQPPVTADSVSISQKNGAALPVTELNLAGHISNLSTPEKVGATVMLAGAIAGGIHGARIGSVGGGRLGVVTGVLGAGIGVISGAAAGSAAGLLIQDLLSPKKAAAQATQPSAPLSDLKGTTPINANRGF